MTCRFLPEAREELIDAALYYEEREPGLGLRFQAEVASFIESIAKDPYKWRERPGGFRRVNFRVFPFYLAYFIRGNTILVAAVAHAHRHPNYWKRRV